MDKQIDIAKYLSDRGVKPSYQRIKILSYLVSKRNHPTVNEIFLDVVNEIPTLSKTTVYNTLNLFIEHGIVLEVLIEENEVRYDFAEHAHGHFKCDVCNRLFDFNIDISTDNISDLKGYHIKENHIYFKGVCNHCLSSGKSTH